MELSLIKGQFTPEESLELLNHLVQVKIRFHENQIKADADEEDIRMRESQISGLQRQLDDIRKEIMSGERRVEMNAVVEFSRS